MTFRARSPPGDHRKEVRDCAFENSARIVNVVEYVNKYCYKGASAGRVCIKCNRDLDKSLFSSTQWGKKAGKSK